jgi:membrane protein required for colicin V production
MAKPSTKQQKRFWRLNMALDITALILILLFFIRGYMKGLLVSICSVLALFLGIVCSLKLSQAFASWMLAKGYTTATWAPILSYLVLFAIVVLLVRLMGKVLQKMLEGLLLGTANKIAGGVLYALMGTTLWSTLIWIGDKMQLYPPTLVQASKTYNLMLLWAPAAFHGIGYVLPFAKDVFEQLSLFFDGVKNHIPAP